MLKSKRSIWVPAGCFLAGGLAMLLGVWGLVGFADVEHVPVRISEARLLDDGRVELVVDSCNGAPRATVSRGDEYIEVEVRAFRFKRHREYCQDELRVNLTLADQTFEPQASLAELLDVHTGEVVDISGGG